MQLALVESPAQLLNVLEWAHLRVLRQDLAIMILAPREAQPRRQLIKMSELALGTGVQVHWRDPRSSALSSIRTIRSLAAEIRGADRLIIGDPFSGFMQLMLTLSDARDLVVVDDGSATIEFADQINSQEDLVRWHRKGQVSGMTKRLAGAARRRLTPGEGKGIELFTAMPVSVPGMQVVRNNFAWTRMEFGTPTLTPSADLVGTSLVETGVVDLDHYLRAVQGLSASQGVTRYLAHRKESWEKLNKVMALGLEIVRPEVPLEIFARIGPTGSRIVSFPSTIVHTLPLVLADLPVEVTVCDIESAWLTAEASPRSDRFLNSVTSLARRAHGLAVVAA